LPPKSSLVLYSMTSIKIGSPHSHIYLRSAVVVVVVESQPLACTRPRLYKGEVQHHAKEIEPKTDRKQSLHIHYQLDNLMHHIQPSPSDKVVDNSRLNRLHSTLATPGRGDNASPSTAVIDSDCNAYSGILNHQQGRAIDYTSPAYALCHGGRTADPHSCTCSNKNACDPIFRLPLAAMQVTG
jgi:hypothetical protein